MTRSRRLWRHRRPANNLTRSKPQLISPGLLERHVSSTTTELGIAPFLPARSSTHRRVSASWSCMRCGRQAAR
eukprot:5042951-Prymnesium_polylepis.1